MAGSTAHDPLLFFIGGVAFRHGMEKWGRTVRPHWQEAVIRPSFYYKLFSMPALVNFYAHPLDGMIFLG